MTKMICKLVIICLKLQIQYTFFSYCNILQLPLQQSTPHIRKNIHQFAVETTVNSTVKVRMIPHDVLQTDTGLYHTGLGYLPLVRPIKMEK